MEFNHSEYKPSKPTTDDGYFEMMSKIVFSTGLNWNVVLKKWPAINTAFEGFSVTKVATFDERAVDQLLNNPGVIRSGSKINAIIKNAQAIQTVAAEYGSMGNYLDKMEKDGPELLLKDLKKRFSYMGDSTAAMFLFATDHANQALREFVKESHK